MTKTEFLDALHAARADWDLTLAQIPETRMTEPGVAGEWSVKDIVAHVTWGEGEMVGVLRQRALVGSDLWNIQLDARNNAVVQESRERPLREVLDEARQVYQDLLPLFESVTDEELNDPYRFAEMPSDWVPWEIIAGNTFRHYRDHLLDLRGRLEQQNTVS